MSADERGDVAGKRGGHFIGRINVVLAQLTPKLRDVAENVRTVEVIVAEHASADLVVFPELFLSGYVTNGLDELALDLDGAEVRAVARAARENDTAVIVGAPERLPDGIANSAICVDRDGNVLACYRKAHLFGEEQGAFVAGEELVIVEIGGVEVGLLICFDVEFPEVARSLALAGADLLITISANMEPFGRDHEVFCAARALENGVPHLYVNQVGEGEVFTFAGGTTAVSADGDRLAGAGTSEEVIGLQLDLSARSDAKPQELRPDYLRQRRAALPVKNKSGSYSVSRNE